MATTNFPTIRLRCLDALYADRSIVRGTATGGSTTTVVDSGAALSGTTTDHFDYAFIKMTTDTAGAAPQGEIRNISEGGYTAATGTWTVSTAFSAAVASGDTYEIHYGPHPNWLDRIINKYGRNFHYKSLWPLSLHLVASDDNDMEASGATSWPTPATGTEAKEASIVFNGRQSLKLTAAAANDYCTTLTDFEVVAGKSYYAAVMASIQDGDSGLFRMWDVTNSASIEVSATVTQVDWTELVLQWAAPSGCRLAEPRLTSVGSNDVTYWDDYQVWANEGALYPLPSWITRKEQIRDVVAFPRGTGSIGGDSDYRSNERGSHSIPWRFEREDYAANQEIYLWVPSIGESRPYVVCERPVSEVSFDYGTAGTGTTANTFPIDSQTSDLLVSGILSEAFLELAGRSQDGAFYEKQAKYHEDIWQNGMAELKPPERKFRSNRIGVRQ